MSPGDVVESSGDLFATVSGVASSKGVALNAPPASILADATRMVRDAMAQVPEGEHGSLVAIATEQDGKVNVNLALATKIGTHVEVVTWIGKSWGTPVAAGVMGRVHF